MQFPNAHKGIGQIFRAEILTLIATILSIIALASAFIGYAAEKAEAASDAAIGGFALGAGGLAVVAGILAIIAFVLTILSINNASKDEDSFRKAMLWLILGIVGSAAQSFGQAGETVQLIGSLLTSLGSMLSTYYVIFGIIKLADRKHNQQVSAKGGRIIKMILGIYVLSLILTIINGFFGGSNSAVTVGGILGIVALILMIVAYILYLTLLSQARKMLEH